MKVSTEQFKKIRTKYETRIYNLMDDMDPTGFNSDTYRIAFSKMSDKQFVDLMKRYIIEDDLNLSIDINQLEKKKSNNMTLQKIKAIADKWKISLFEYVFMPFRNPKGKPMCTLTKVPIIYCPIRRFFQQMLQHKNAISNNNERINPLTGQVVQEDKTASTTNVQTYALVATNQHNALKEFLGPRADDQHSKQQMLNTIVSTGDVRLSDLDIHTHNKQAVNTSETFCKAAGLDIKFSGNNPGSFTMSEESMVNDDLDYDYDDDDNLLTYEASTYACSQGMFGNEDNVVEIQDYPILDDNTY